MAIKFEVTDKAGLQEFKQAVQYAIVEEYGEKWASEIKAALEKKTVETVEKRVRELTDKRLKAAVDEILDKGVQSFDQWGGARDKPVSLPVYVRKLLDRKSSDWGGAPTVLEKMFEDAAKAAIDKEFAAELAKIRAAFKAQIDGLLQAKLRESLAAALGLKG